MDKLTNPISTAFAQITVAVGTNGLAGLVAPGEGRTCCTTWPARRSVTPSEGIEAAVAGPFRGP
jgi:hypothetical protein